MIKNAIITGAEVEIEDHGCLTAWLYLDYGGSGQGFGGYILGVSEHSERKDETKESMYCHIFLRKCLEIAGVSKWSRLQGKTIRVETDGRVDFSGKIIGIGHIIKDDWFYPKVEADKIFERDTVQ